MVLRTLAAQPVGQRGMLSSSMGPATRIRTWNYVTALCRAEPSNFVVSVLFEIALSDLPRSPLREVGWFHSVGLEPSGLVRASRVWRGAESGRRRRHCLACWLKATAARRRTPVASRTCADLGADIGHVALRCGAAKTRSCILAC